MELLICKIMTSDTASNNIMQIRKMADYNLLLVAIPEDTHKSESINQKYKLKTLL